jgi:RNA polymerase alpha subunit
MEETPPAGLLIQVRATDRGPSRGCLNGCTSSGRGTAISSEAMPTRPPRDVSAATIRGLGLPGRAVTALTRAGVTQVDDLAGLTRQDLAGIAGLGPGMVAAIRQIVPEPPARGVRSGASPDAGREFAVPPAGPDAEPAEQESPAAPMIPSFASLRAPRRGSAVDLLMPEPPPEPPPSAPSSPASPASPAPAATRAPRPPEYADLLRLGVVVLRAVVGLSGRMAVWSVREPVRCLRRLLP